MSWQDCSLTAAQLKSIYTDLQLKISQLQQTRVLVVGDIGLDEYLVGDVRRISPEAPVPVLDVNSTDQRLGLSGNVAQNVASLGGQAELLAVVGADAGAEILAQMLEAEGVSGEHLVVDQDRPTTRKTRLMSEHHHIARVDFEHRRPLPEKIQRQVIERFESLVGGVDGVVIEDYAKGLFSESLLSELIALSHKHGKKVMADPHRSTPLEYYKGVDLFKPNRDEAIILSGLDFADLKENPNVRETIPQDLMRRLGCEHLVITQGKQGMSLFHTEKTLHLPTFARQVFDVTGAGDTVLAAMSLGWFGGLSLEQACTLANLAAGQVVAKVGCVPCDLEELKSELAVLIEKASED